MKPVYTPAAQLKEWFPRLRTVTASKYKLTSPIDRFYNCVAWAMNDSEKWWEPAEVNFPLTYWPIERRGYSVAAYVEMFESQGYSVCNDGAVEADTGKIVIYRKLEGDDFSHVARQTPDPKPGWLSKCGAMSDIWHETPELLEGPTYGEVACYMRRVID